MYFTGFADEAATDIQGQIRACRELGWTNIESRAVNGANIHDLPDDEFAKVADTFDEAGIHVNCFGSTIANWGKRIDEPFDSSWEAAQRAIPRMKRLGTELIRIMSFAVLEDREPDDQMEEERFRRLRELVKLFGDEGLKPVHENCMNYGGMGPSYTLRMLENVPGLRLVYDTGNPAFSDDRVGPRPWKKQSSWDFYTQVKPYVDYVHVKDGIWDTEKGKIQYTYPGEGDGDVRRIVKDLLDSDYAGGLSIEPHMTRVFHEGTKDLDEEATLANYVEYGRRMMRLVDELS